MIERLGDAIICRRYGRGLIRQAPLEADIAAAREGLREAAAAVRSAAYDVVILDEVNVAVQYGLVELDELLGLIEEKPATVELVLTGRNALLPSSRRQTSSPR